MSMDQVLCEDLPFLVGRVVLKREGARRITGDGEKDTRIQQTAADQYTLHKKRVNGSLATALIELDLGDKNSTKNVEANVKIGVVDLKRGHPFSDGLGRLEEG